MSALKVLEPSPAETMPAQHSGIVGVSFVSPWKEDVARLHEIFDRTRWTLYHARDYREAASQLRTLPVPIVIADAHIPPPGSWRDLLRVSTPVGQPRVIVAAREPDDWFYNEVLVLGGYDILVKPFVQADVIHLVSIAWLDHRRQLREESRRRDWQVVRSGTIRGPVKSRAEIQTRLKFAM